MTIEKLWDFLFELISTLGIKILSTILIMLVGFKLIKWLKKWIKTSHKLDKMDDGVRSFISSFIGIILYIVLFVTIATRLGIPTASFVAALASAFAAIGLAMQGSLSNFAGGMLLLLFKPFKVGDYIKTEEAEGTVAEITTIYTILHTYDNKTITIPNGTLTNSVIENYTTAETRRVDLEFSTSYDSDVETVKKLLMEVLENHPLVLEDPEPTARLSEHGDSALKFTAKAWCNTDDYWTVKYDLTEAVKKTFDDNNIEIPFPQMDVHVDNK